MSDRVRTSVLFSLLACLAACGGGSDASTTKCPEGMSSPATCAGRTDLACPGGTLVAMCSGGQWSACACSAPSSITSGQASGGSTAAPAVSVCGDGKAEGEEQCDTSDLKGMTCATLAMGSPSGVLKCNARCSFDTIMCFTGGAAASTGGTGAGGTGARTPATPGTAGSGGSGR